jgi:hypothetical protein
LEKLVINPGPQRPLIWINALSLAWKKPARFRHSFSVRGTFCYLPFPASRGSLPIEISRLLTITGSPVIGSATVLFRDRTLITQRELKWAKTLDLDQQSDFPRSRPCL